MTLNSIKRNLWGYPSIYTKLRQLKRTIIPHLSPSEIEKRPEFSQINQIMNAPESRYLINLKSNGIRVLNFSLRGAWTTHTAWETVIALGLRLRNAHVEFFTCGGVLPCCGMGDLNHPPCISCYHYLLNFIQPFNFHLKVGKGTVSSHRFQKTFQILDSITWQEVYHYEYKGLNLGQIVLPMVRWYLRRSKFPEDEQTLNVYRKFLKSAVLIVEISKILLKENTYDVIFCLNGEFFAEAIIRILAKQKGIRVVTYERGYHPDSLFFQHDDPACKYVVERYWRHVASISLTEKENLDLDRYLSIRQGGVKGIGGLVFWPRIEQDELIIRNTLSLEPDKPLAVLFTNTTFDTMTQNMEVIFQDMFHWIKTTIEFFKVHPEWQLVIRIHPSEVRDTGRESNEPVAKWIEATFSTLPANIKIVQPESTLSSYTLMRMSQVGLVYTSLAGLEMALMSKPVIVAGKAHYREKGFTDDPVSSQHYIEILKNRLSVENILTNNQLEIARRYAYLFFFRTMIPFNLLSEPKRGEVVLNFNTLSDLLPGRSKELDVICNGILNGEDFLL